MDANFDMDLAIEQACDQAQRFLDQLRKNKPQTVDNHDPRMGDVRVLDALLRQIPDPALHDRPQDDIPLRGLHFGFFQPGSRSPASSTVERSMVSSAVPTAVRVIASDKQVDWNNMQMMAEKAGAKFPELVAAQWALESSFGTAVSGKNNYFGIKGDSGTLKTTQEEVHGQMVTVDACFANFKSAQDCIDYLVRLWYKDYVTPKGQTYQGVNRQPTREAAAEALKAQGYATDSNYPKKLIALMNQYAPVGTQLIQDSIPVARDFSSSGDKRVFSVTSRHVSRGLQVGGLITSCDTGLIQGLSLQVLDKLMANEQGVLTRIDHDLIKCEGAQNNPFLQPAAYQALVNAVEERGTKMVINSCLRTPMQQYMLFEQKNCRLCGITAAAPPPNSNHNSGLAIDLMDAEGWKPFLERHSWRWLGSFDPMHFDYTPSGVDLGGLQLKTFQQLWNDNNPEDVINDDGIWGPKTAACIDCSPSQGFGVSPTLSGGMINDEVGRLQLMLRKVLKLAPEQLKADCQFGPATAKCVSEFQKSKGLKDDGSAGPATIKALEQETGESLMLD